MTDPILNPVSVQTKEGVKVINIDSHPRYSKPPEVVQSPQPPAYHQWVWGDTVMAVAVGLILFGLYLFVLGYNL